MKYNNNLDDIILIGITGSIGSGKSEFAKIVVEKGFPVISSDENAKMLMSTDDRLKEKLINAFGEISYINGELNKSYISDIIFGSSKESKQKLELMNSIVHPRVIEFMEKEIERLANTGAKIIFIESALMIETGVYEAFDYLIAIITKEEIAIERVINRSKLSREQVISRLKTQISQEKKTELADFSINNNGTLDDLRKSSEFIFELIPFLPPKDFDNEESDEEE